MNRTTTTSDDRPSPWNPLSVAWLTALWIAVFANWPLWHALDELPEMSGLRGRLFMLAFCGMVAGLTALCLTLAAWRWTFKPVATVFLLAAAFGAYFMGTYGIVIDPSMMLNVLQTDVRETRDLLSLRMAGLVLVIGIIPAVLLWRADIQALPAWRQIKRNLLGVLGALVLSVGLLMLFFADMSGTMRTHKSLRYLINPLNSFYAVGRLVSGADAPPSGPVLPVGTDAQLLPRAPNSKPPLLVLMVGETARSANFSLNGYGRLTNPELMRLDVLSFRQVSSCGTNTAASLPCMFSSLGKQAYEDDDQRRENLLDVVQRAGMAVLWVDNQAGCKGVCDRVAHAHTNEPIPGATPLAAGLCDGGECLDMALLHGLDERLAALPAEQRARGVLVVMHPMGSHGPAYSKRSPPDRKPFTPECTTNVLQQCEKQSLVNAYDNTIAYADHVIASTIGWLKQRSSDHATAMLYLSDHGESLGENNLYLHGMPYAVAPRFQIHVPMIFWTSASLAFDNGIDTTCLTERLDAPLSHDNLFHTTLGLLKVKTTTYKPALDAFGVCRRAH
jgi:lipid A ethanolaminephosphotransferase